MTSLPSQPSRRRSSSPRASSPTEEVPPHDTDIAESQWIPLNQPEASTASSTSAVPGSATPPPVPEDARICWICQQDETEDGADDGPWRNPCSCSLTAHEPCLLEWIANQESPKPNVLVASELTCPQCKGAIMVERPRNPIVDIYSSAEALARVLVLPAALSGLLGCVYAGLTMYGRHATYMVFGSEDATSRRGLRYLMNVLNPKNLFFPTSQVEATINIAHPLIAPALVLLRTGLADQASALLLSLYFLVNLNRSPYWNDAIVWSPTPGLTFAAIPFIKKVYNSLYHHTFSALEKDWERAVLRKPREGETAEDIEQQAAGNEGRAVFDFEWRQEEERLEVPPAAANADALAADAEPNPNPGAAPQVRREVRHQWALRQDLIIAKVVTTVTGALFFPAISSGMGEILKALLPPRLVSYSRGGGLLREKWGRTVVGGCLFVVLKDVVTLYVKWRRAKDFGKRKVLDYVGKKGVRGR